MSEDDDISTILKELNEKVRTVPVSRAGNFASSALHQRCRSMTLVKGDFSDEPHPKSGASCRPMENGLLELNEETLRRIAQAARDDKLLPGLDRQEQMRVGISLFALHEANHVVQGVGEYDYVKLIKASAGKRQFVRFDLKSDIAAALTLATLDANIEDVGGIGRAYLANLNAAMSMSIHLFPLPPDNHYKISRLISLFASHQSFIHSIMAESPMFPTIYYSLSEDFKCVSIIEISDAEIERFLTAKTLTQSARLELETAVGAKCLPSLLEALTSSGIFA